MTSPSRRTTLAALSALALTVGLSACSGEVSTGSFKGESKVIAESIANLQTNATDANDTKVCEDDIAAPVKRRLEKAGSTCIATMKSQLGQIDSFEVAVKSVKVTGDDATAVVESVTSGKKSLQTLSMVKEGRSWKLSGLVS